MRKRVGEEVLETLVSVIVPVYNVEPFLRRCVDSILRQDHKNMEIILVDDGSKDNCGMICDEYGLKDKRIKVIHKDNGGLSDARNVGMTTAGGEYVTFIDSDDYIAPFMISDMLKVAIKSGCKLVQCEFACGTEDDYKFERKSDFVVRHSREAFETRETKVCVCGKLFHKSLIANSSFRTGKIHEDEFFTYQKIFESGKIILLREPLYYYYQQATSITHQRQKFLNIDIIEAFDERIKFFEDRDEKRLADVSKKEKCIREILLFAKAKNCEDKEEKRKWLLEMYKNEYSQIRHIKYDFKEKLLLEMFYWMPVFVNFFLERYKK